MDRAPGTPAPRTSPDSCLGEGVADPTQFVRPETIARMDGPDVDALLDRLDPLVPSEPALVLVAPAGSKTLGVIGDTHGDWRSSRAAVEWFLDSVGDRAFVGLGDYVDRAPTDSPAGSAVNALFLVSLKAAYPDRVFLLRGNHEAGRRIPFEPHTLPEEMRSRWGPDRRRYDRLIDLLERGPLAAYTLSGVFLAHGGFPSRLTSPWTDRFRNVDDSLLVDLLWRDAAASPLDRGLSPAFTERDLEEFFHATGLRVFLRGHDPNVAGRSLYQDRCLTLHTTRLYAEYGGILAAHVPLDRPVRSTRDIAVVHLRSSGGAIGPDSAKRTRAPPPEGPQPTEPSGTLRAGAR